MSSEDGFWVSGGERLRLRQHQMDRQVRRWVEAYEGEGGRIHCGKGCAACCSLAVHTSLTEAVLLAQTLNPRQIAVVADHVARLLDALMGVTDLKTYLRTRRDAVGPCPLLSPDGACDVYEVRPLTCRALLATRPADWCAIDLSTLPELEKKIFLSSLDPRIVAYPTYYAADPQELGRELESLASLEMREALGFSLEGNLPYLLFLQTRYRLSRIALQGSEATQRFLEETGLDHPLLLRLSVPVSS